MNDGSGDQFDPHIDCNLASYTNDDFVGASTLRYYDFSTNTDHLIPGNGQNFFSGVSGARITFTEATALGDETVIFDTTTQTG